MDTTLRWYALFVHAKHKLKSGVDHWADCEYWPCFQLQAAVLKGLPQPYESDNDFVAERWVDSR